MKPILKTVLSLLVIATLSTVLLWGSDALTRSGIQQQQSEKVAGTFAALLPAKRFEPLTSDDDKPILAAYRAYDDAERLMGFAVSVQVQGYVGPITVHVALSPDATTVYGTSIGEHRESIGYGAGITEDTFLKQFSNRTPPFSLSTGGRVLQDGVYRAAAADFDYNGFRDVVELTVSGHAITAVNWDGEQKNGKTKKELSRAGEYTMSETGLPWHEQAEIMEQALLKTQDPAALVFEPDTGKTDAYSGATISVEPFVRLAATALAQATASGNTTAIDGVSGATASSTAVVNAVNTAASFAKTKVG